MTTNSINCSTIAFASFFNDYFGVSDKENPYFMALSGTEKGAIYVGISRIKNPNTNSFDILSLVQVGTYHYNNDFYNAKISLSASRKIAIENIARNPNNLYKIFISYCKHVEYKDYFMGKIRYLADAIEKENQITIYHNDTTINIAEILFNDEGKYFFSPQYGKVKIVNVNRNHGITFKYKGERIKLSVTGRDSNGNIGLYPSEENHDWLKYAKEKELSPTWGDLIKSGKLSSSEIQFYNNYCEDKTKNSVIDAYYTRAVALNMVLLLIKYYYGGELTNEERLHGENWQIGFDWALKTFIYHDGSSYSMDVLFRSKSEAQRFLKNEENVELLIVACGLNTNL